MALDRAILLLNLLLRMKGGVSGAAPATGAPAEQQWPGEDHVGPMPRDDDGEEPLGATVDLNGHAVLVGTCSWTDRTLIRETEWYPRGTMSAEERLRFYAARFPLVEVDSTYYRPLTEGQAATWAERSPEGFRFNVKAYSLLTGHPTQPRSLWPDLRELLDEEAREKRSIYATHLPEDAVEVAWRRFDEALEPLRAADKLGAVLVQYPHWAGPRRETRRELEALPERLPGTRICVEFRSPRWLAEREDRERTLGRLEELGLALVCVDAPKASRLPRLFATTTEQLAALPRPRRRGVGQHGRQRRRALPLRLLRR
jgi:uncharacterized protein YecE (DUF72 family)